MSFRRIKKKRYQATMRVTYVEIWEVKAESETEAANLFDSPNKAIKDAVGEMVDWETSSIKEIKD